MNMNHGKEITILIVDDEKEFRQVLQESARWTVMTA